jgi:uncharacterized protein GlcG (DUF336 family)
MAEISRSKARSIITRALAFGRESGLRPLAVIVVDAGGHPKAYERDDGATAGRYPIAEGKAYGAVMMGMGGYALRERAEKQAYFMDALGRAYNGKMVPVPGGVLVRDKRGVIIGAVGVTGDTSENDAAAAVAGIEGAGFTAEA